MIIVGRVTKDAKITQLQDERKVVNFSVAINDYYKPKGQERGVQVATFVNCSYWISAAIADHLKKGTVVELFGRIGLNVYSDMKGEARGTLTFHTNHIKIQQVAKDKAAGEASTKKEYMKAKEPIEDLPF